MSTAADQRGHSQCAGETGTLTWGRRLWQPAPREREGRKEGGGRRGRSVPESPATSGTYAQKEQHVAAVWSKNKQAAKRKRLSPGRKRKGKRSHSPLLEAQSGVQWKCQESLRQQDHLLGTVAFVDTSPASVSAKVSHSIIKPALRHKCFSSLGAPEGTLRVNYSPPQLWVGDVLLR